MKRFFVFAMFLWTGILGVNAQEDRCDVNGDGVVNIADVTYVIDHVLGKGHASTPQAIDLGLPSGTKWASCNVGATKPEEYGGYYAWGETEEKEVYNWSTYIHCDGSSSTCHDLGSDISGTEYDVAHVKWGGDWVMPTLDDIKELRDNCISEWTTVNGVNGRKFTGPNGNSIFLPAAGYRWNGDLDDAAGGGYYWSSTQDPSTSYLACFLGFYSGDAKWYRRSRDCGQSVRPVVRN
ncbi:MAG: hypothetical protein IKX24_03545 [Prevotella sp.]|nr:hypothetical protein [Prevotella sp.]